MQNITPVRVERLPEADLGEEEIHPAPFNGSLRVVSLERLDVHTVVAEYWTPKSEGKLWDLLYKVTQRGLMLAWGRDPNEDAVPVRVRVRIDYPLQDAWEVEVTISANEFGRVFSVAYDMYWAIYEMDDAEWGGVVPRNESLPLNRAHGKYVWGHDMKDLVFEQLIFSVAPGAEPIEPSKLPLSPERRRVIRAIQSQHFSIEPTLLSIAVYCDESKEAIYLIGVNTEAIETEVVEPASFKPHGEISMPLMMADVTPSQWQRIESGELSLPKGWPSDLVTILKPPPLLGTVSFGIGS